MPETTPEASAAARLPELRPRGLGELLDLSFRIYRRHFRLLALFGVVTGLIIGTFSLLGQWVIAAASRPGAGESAIFVSAFLAGVLLLYGGLLLLYCTTFLVTCFVVEDDLMGRASVPRALLARALNRLPAAIGTSVVVGMTVLIGLLFLFLPGLFALVVLALAVPIVALEKRAGSAAMSRSSELILRRGGRGLDSESNWVRVVVIGVLMIGVNYALAILAAAPMLLLIGLRASQGRFEMEDTALGPQMLPLPLMLPLTLLSQVIQGLFLSLPMVAWPVLYFDIRIRHEGLDLMLATERLAARDPGVAPAMPPPLSIP